jgi:uncharacterized membrane protein YgcG
MKINNYITILLLLVANIALARPQLHNLDIKVVLSRNGDARITETRLMSIDSEGTECYIGLANMGESEVKDLEVRDESGARFLNVDWDIHQDRSWKTMKCGIVRTKSGYEICWGLGESGERTYVTTYTMTGLVRGYPDANAMRHVFLDEGVNPKPGHAKVTIMGEDSTMVFDADSCNVWGFRFNGEVWFESGMVMAETTDGPMSSEAGLYVMAQFPLSMFEPHVMESVTFEEKKGEAFEGSDYTDNGDEEVDWDDPMTLFGFIYVLVIFVSPVVGGIWFVVYKWRARRRVNKDLMWYRDIPLKGDLQEANNILNAYKWCGADYNNLLSACILKLIDLGAIAIETHPNSKGKLEPNFTIYRLPDADKQPVLLRKIHNIFERAAGGDKVLEPQELKQFMKSTFNSKITDSFIDTLHSQTSIKKYKNREFEVREVLGLKKFLKEFTLLDERGVDEVKLWKDYMVYATLFGIADQVISDMKKINPEYFNMDKVAAQMANDMTLPTIYSVMHRSTARAATSKASRESRARGGGGHSSFHGGGGGFSGGGGGGGVR